MQANTTPDEEIPSSWVGWEEKLTKYVLETDAEDEDEISSSFSDRQRKLAVKYTVQGLVLYFKNKPLPALDMNKYDKDRIITASSLEKAQNQSYFKNNPFQHTESVLYSITSRSYIDKSKAPMSSSTYILLSPESLSKLLWLRKLIFDVVCTLTSYIPPHNPDEIRFNIFVGIMERLNPLQKKEAQDMKVSEIIYSDFEECIERQKSLINIVKQHDDLQNYLKVTESTCSICLEDCINDEVGDFEALLSCQHFLCISCANAWFNIRDTCPYCRAEVPISASKYTLLGYKEYLDLHLANENKVDDNSSSDQSPGTEQQKQ